MTAAFILITLGVLLISVDEYLYSKNDRVIKIVLSSLSKLGPVTEETSGHANSALYAWHSRFTCVFPLLSCWLIIFGATMFSYHLGSSVVWLFVSFVAANRFRALQEISHYAIHGIMCPSKTYQFILADVFFQFPLFKRNSESRYISHVKKHHRYAGTDLCPNMIEFKAIGFKPKLHTSRFILFMIYPLWLSNIIKTVTDMMSSFFSDKAHFAIRVWAAACVLVLFYLSGGWKGLCYGYVIPVLTIYPELSWISQLLEHKWFADPRAYPDSLDEEIKTGRATDYPGIIGSLTRICLFPYGDSFHLAHSLFPFARWNQLPEIDRLLKKYHPGYRVDKAEGLFWNKTGSPSAISWVYNTLTNTVDLESLKLPSDLTF